MDSEEKGTSSYDFGAAVAERKKAKVKKRSFKVVAIIVGVICAVILAVVGCVAWYTSTIAGNLALDKETSQQLEGVLAETESKTFYTLILGRDNEVAAQGEGRRADVIILARIDTEAHQVTLVSVPRDTAYYIGDEKVKINETYRRDGAAGIVKAVQNLTGVPIAHYVEIDFNGLREFIDLLGGITVDVPYAFSDGTTYYQPGGQRITGSQALTIARARNIYNDGTSQDAIRQTCDRALVVGMVNEILALPKTELPGTVQELSKCVSTDMSLDRMINLALDFAENGITIYTCTGPYKGGTDPETGLWLCDEDPEGWHNLMVAVNAGEDPANAETTIQGK